MKEEKIIYKKVSELKLNEKNPRKNDDAVETVAKSIQEFGFKNPLIIDSNGKVWCGNTRLKASRKLGLKEVPCIVADDLTEEQIRKLALIDNKSSEIADWDYDLLGEELADLDLSDFDLDWNIEQDKGQKYAGGGTPLIESFIAPPLSVLDTKQGYWQDRKRMWKEMGIKSEIGRDDDLIGGFKQLAESAGTGTNGTSVFDPALCEVMYKWFCPQNGIVYDCFAGGSVRGIIAEKLGYKYIGIDLRKEQVDANIINAKELNVSPTWYCDDSLNVDNYIDNESVDMIFSCPPYFDLEQYSDDERDLSNMEYEDFKKVYFEIIKKACNKLKNDRFAVFVVGNVRDKQGFYRDFVDFTRQSFEQNGVKFYNDMILLDSISTAALRAKKQFKNRKVVKVHQNILVFYKGEIKNIRNNFNEIDVGNIEETLDI